VPEYPGATAAQVLESLTPKPGCDRAAQRMGSSADRSNPSRVSVLVCCGL